MSLIRRFNSTIPLRSIPLKRMNPAQSSLSHLERTAEEPRDETLHTVKISFIKQINPHIKTFHLQPKTLNLKSRLNFLPGQWLDVYCPGIPKAGGFTITSSPSLLSPSRSETHPYLELAIQKSPQNPAAHYLWLPPSQILNTELKVRVGGNFFWPPPFVREGGKVKRVVFIAGGMGINPLISMVSFLAEEMEKMKLRFQVAFLYSFKGIGGEGEVLFLERLRGVMNSLGQEGALRIFITNENGGSFEIEGVEGVDIEKRRINEEDLVGVLGPVEERNGTVCYICGVPSMTDEFVGRAKVAEGMDEMNVLFEKWW